MTITVSSTGSSGGFQTGARAPSSTFSSSPSFNFSSVPGALPTSGGSSFQAPPSFNFQTGMGSLVSSIFKSPFSTPGPEAPPPAPNVTESLGLNITDGIKQEIQATTRVNFNTPDVSNLPAFSLPAGVAQDMQGGVPTTGGTRGTVPNVLTDITGAVGDRVSGFMENRRAANEVFARTGVAPSRAQVEEFIRSGTIIDKTGPEPLVAGVAPVTGVIGKGLSLAKGLFTTKAGLSTVGTVSGVGGFAGYTALTGKGDIPLASPTETLNEPSFSELNSKYIAGDKESVLSTILPDLPENQVNNLPGSSVQSLWGDVGKLLTAAEERIELEKRFGVRDDGRLNTRTKAAQDRYNQLLLDESSQVKGLRNSVAALNAKPSTAQTTSAERIARTMFGNQWNDLSINVQNAATEFFKTTLPEVENLTKPLNAGDSDFIEISGSALLTPQTINEEYFVGKVDELGNPLRPNQFNEAGNLLGRRFVNKNAPEYRKQSDEFVKSFYDSNPSIAQDQTTTSQLRDIFDKTVLKDNAWDAIKPIEDRSFQFTQRTTETQAIMARVLDPAKTNLETFRTSFNERVASAQGDEQRQAGARLLSDFESQSRSLAAKARTYIDQYERGAIRKETFEENMNVLAAEYDSVRNTLDFNLTTAEKAEYNKTFWSRQNWKGDSSYNWAESVIPALSVGVAAGLPILTTFWLNPRERDRDFEKQKKLMDLQYQYWLKQLDAQMGYRGGGGGGGGGGGDSFTPSGANYELAKG